MLSEPYVAGVVGFPKYGDKCWRFELVLNDGSSGIRRRMVFTEVSTEDAESTRYVE